MRHHLRERLWPLAFALLLLVGWALPAHAATPITITAPAEGATVQSPVPLDFHIGGVVSSYSLRLEVARGKNATSGFTEVSLTYVPDPASPKTIRGIEWDATGFNPGPYTLHMKALRPDTWELLAEGYRNVVLQGPDFSPKVRLNAPAAVSGTALIDVTITDDDLAGWTLEALDGAGGLHPIANGADAAAFPVAMTTGDLPDGTYTLRLTAWDSKGNRATAEQTVAVSSPAPVLRPGLATVDRGETTLPVAYTAVSAVQVDLAILGDGGRIVAHGQVGGNAGENTVAVPVNLRGLAPGRYTATIAVKDQQNRLTTDTFAVIVREPGPAPVVAEFPAYTTGDFTVEVIFPAVEIKRIEIVITDAGGASVIHVPRLPLPALQVSLQEQPVREGRLAYRIVLYLADGRIAESEERTTIVDLRPPTVGDLSVATVDGLGLNMRWEPATDTVGIKGYEVILVEGGAERVLATLGPDARSYAAALPEGEYGVALTAVDLAGQRASSRLVSFQVQAGAVALMRGGKLLPTDVAGFAEDGSTWVPLRLFGEALGYKVSWDGPTQTAAIVDEQGRRTMLATIGDTRLRIQGPGGEQVVEVPAAPRLVGGRVLVPLRALAEALGAEVTWHQELRTVELK